LFKNTTCRGEYYAEIHNKELNGRETAAFDLILVLKTYHIERPQYPATHYSHTHVPCECSEMECLVFGM